MILINTSYTVSATRPIICLGCYRQTWLNPDRSKSQITSTCKNHQLHVHNHNRVQYPIFLKYSHVHFGTYVYLEKKF